MDTVKDVEFPPDINMNYNVTTNNFYLTFWKTGIPTLFVILVGIRWFIAIIGFFTNLILFWVFAVNRKTFQGTCHILIGTNALTTSLFEFSLTIGFIMQLIGIQFVNIPICLALQAFPIFCRNFIISSICVIALDRLLSTAFMSWHLKNGETLKYKIFLFSFCFIHGISFVAASLYSSIIMPELKEVCISSDDCYQGKVENILFHINVAIFLIVLVFYIAIWIFLRTLHKSNASLDWTKRIIKSLTLTALTITTGWLSYNALQAFLLPAISNWFGPVQFAYFSFIFSFLPYIAMALNAPILVIFSKDYRLAFCKTFWFIPGLAQFYAQQHITSIKINSISPSKMNQNNKIQPSSSSPLFVKSKDKRVSVKN
ncbi:G_PROTEIN_RECEP_F1_2 domain-containing protein [Meloidogyne graminicola]|uniref:G_PROTEIN_RECEP_F1_2 domain-containing protein n=1 Tax=Meloidogyne graminicola TaxID=189291 RepID=A0A8S9ZK26_9BILA|nr:G_PROTEIN_RECEP_F1_2 domain-containing protein [Meloidogyne graminicola]